MRTPSRHAPRFFLPSPSAASFSKYLAACAVALVCGLSTSALADQPNLVQCRQYDAEFDYTGVLTECGVAAGDQRTTPTERLEVFRLLGFAHTALGSPDKAQIWYLRLLAIDPTHKLGREVSPRFREGFAKAKRKFRKAGRVRASHAPVVIDDKSELDKPIPLEVTLSDPLGRVATMIAKVDVQAPNGASKDAKTKGDSAKTPPPNMEVILTKGAVDGTTVTFTGALPSIKALAASAPDADTLDVNYRFEMQSAMGAKVKPSPKLPPVTFQVKQERLAAIPPATETPGKETGSGGSEDESEGLGTGALVGLGISGAAAGGLLLTAAVGGSITFFCLQNERCTAPAPRSRPAASARINVN